MSEIKAPRPDLKFKAKPANPKYLESIEGLEYDLLNPWVYGKSILQLAPPLDKNQPRMCIIPSGTGFFSRGSSDLGITEMHDVLFLAVKPETVCQWTGAVDKNGAEIYIHDSVKSEDGRLYEVCRVSGDLVLCNGGSCELGLSDFFSSYDFEKDADVLNLTVVGNAYDDKEEEKHE